jgi:predicted nucleic-acid-binding protein
MLAVDTNVLVRFLTGDHPVQSARARALVANHQVFVCATVLLETEWVLRSGYGYAAPKIREAFGILAGAPNVVLEDPALVSQALEWMQAGMDFADALHLSKAQNCEAFVSFDREFVRIASRAADVKVRAP